MADHAESRWALVVATSAYEDPGLTQLRAPATDAQDIADVLGDPRIGGFNVTTLLDQPEHQVRRRVDDFLTERDSGDLVLVYLSCHGVQDARGRLFFATTDTVKARLASTALSSTWLQDQLEECRARRQVLILDCCFSGAFGQAKGETEIDLRGSLAGSGRGRAVLTASRAGEYSFEGKPFPDAVQIGSVFTAALVEGLRTGEADLDQDGWITVDEAFTFSANKVAASGVQNPQRYLHAAEGAIVLARNPNDRKVIATTLPEALRLALESPLPQVRRGAVAAVGDWLNSDDRSRVNAARQTLELIAAQDIPVVRNAARDLLSGHADVLQEEVAVVAAKDVPAEADAPKAATSPASTRRTFKHLHDNWFFSDVVRAVDFSRNGCLLASGGEDKRVRLWDPATGEAVGEPLKGPGWVRAVAFSPDGRLLASGSGSSVLLWDLDRGAAEMRWSTDPGDMVWAVAFSPDGRLLASAGGDRVVRLWDPCSGEAVGELLKGHMEQIWAVAFSPDGRLLASAGADRVVRLWDPCSGEAVGELLKGHTGQIWAVALSPDGRLLASAGADRVVRLWDPRSGKAKGKPLKGHTGLVRAVAFSPDGRLLASGGDDRVVQLWDAREGEAVGQPLSSHAGGVSGVAFSPDGRLLAGACDTAIMVWSVE